MELLLNLVWLATALLVAAIGLAGANAGVSSAKRWQIAIAVVCLCVVLFPVISVSDDLQQVEFTSESRTVVLSEVHSHFHTNLLFISLLLLLLLQATLAASYFSRKVFIPAFPRDGFLRLVISRPPPAALP